MPQTEDQERIPLELTREQWDAVKWALIYAANKRRYEKSLPTSMLETIERVDEAHRAIAAKLRAQDAGEGE